MHEEQIRIEKKEIRKKIRGVRDAISAAQKAAWDARLCARVIESESFRDCKILLIYAPTGSEVAVMPIAEEAWRQGKRVAFPICHVESCTVRFHEARSADELVSGEYGIAAPSAEAPAYAGEADALCIVPGLVFDRQGYRIGYGKGYYDRFLSDFDGISMGLTYTALLCERLPRGRYDLPVDILVTEEEVCAPDGKEKEKEIAVC